MRPGSRLNWLGIFSGVSLLAAVVLTVVELVLFSRTFATLPAGLSLAHVPVGGLSEQSALEQLLLVYRAPLELHYQDQVILLEPAAVNFQVDTTLMLPQVNQYRSNDNFWTGFWDYLWLQPGQTNDVPLQATYSRERLQAFLEDVAARYDRPGSPPKANPDKLGFVPGEPGHALDVAAAVSLVDARLRSPSDRTVDLPVTEQTAIRPGFDTLSELIQQDVSLFQFQGVVSLYLADLSTGRELELNLINQQSTEGRIAFSGMSTIKIPIMVTFFAHNQGALTDEQNLLLKRSIDESQNAATDLLLKTIGRGDGFEGTRIVTADMQRLGLPNTYIAGLLDTLGAVLLPLGTPANSRTDINTQPDPYNQTTAETGVVLAAHIGAALGLRHNSPLAAEAARNKYRMRTLLADVGLLAPWFKLFTADTSPAAAAAEVTYPCVLKPTGLSGSRGVIRANNAQEFEQAFKRVGAIAAAAGSTEILVEGYIAGRELALEGLLSTGRLRVLALFDKPDPLEGPYFEETLYVTPSREPAATQAAIADCVAEAARALGLSEGAVHAEVRVNPAGPWLIELAGRSIGGLCAQTLRFAHNAEVSLEELILRQALGLDDDGMERENRAGGVMMIPIPAAGTLLGWDGVEDAQAVPGVESVEITARLNYPLVPLPEGDSYLGFIFARGDTPAEVEAALRTAHAALRFNIEPELSMAGAAGS